QHEHAHPHSVDNVALKCPATQRVKGDQPQKRCVHSNINSCNSSNTPRPLHCLCFSLLSTVVLAMRIDCRASGDVGYVSLTSNLCLLCFSRWYDAERQGLR